VNDAGGRCRWASCEAYRMANSDLRLLRQLLLEEGYWVVKTESDKRYRALQADATGQKPAGNNRGSYSTSGVRSSYAAQHHTGATQHSPTHRASEQGMYTGGRPNTGSIRTNGSALTGGVYAPAAASAYVQPDTATVRTSMLSSRISCCFSHVLISMLLFAWFFAS
jgi:hypothetical protein